ncbi:MAG: KamA family radical SAM protein [Lachnospiraceae bacterium]|nr:KamA family radical SAM protein [Lachnospiraceae bacterium]
MENSREISLKRAARLKAAMDDYVAFRKAHIDEEAKKDVAGMKRRIMEYFNATEDDWRDWKWQVSNRISSADVIGEFLNLSPEEKKGITDVEKTYRWACTPYYLSLMSKSDHSYPINRMAIPSIMEMDDYGVADPMDEEHTNPAPCITRRYPDRLIINVTSACAMFCRHCQRRRLIGECDSTRSREDILAAIQYIRENEEIRDVLVTGGDPLLLDDSYIEFVLKELRTIEHVQILRIGTRVPVTMPQRITPQLCEMLKKYHPLYINLQFNHPDEVTAEAKAACTALADAGIALGNQMVFLKGINNDKFIVRLLNERLLMARVKPYYIFHPKQVIGTRHFSIRISEGLEIMRYLRGQTSGLAIPTYILNAPFGLGKIPLLPEYIIENSSEGVKLRTWEGGEIEINEE